MRVIPRITGNQGMTDRAVSWSTRDASSLGDLVNRIWESTSNVQTTQNILTSWVVSSIQTPKPPIDFGFEIKGWLAIGWSGGVLSANVALVAGNQTLASVLLNSTASLGNAFPYLAGIHKPTDATSYRVRFDRGSGVTVVTAFNRGITARLVRTD